jgi:hypothetical protein
MKLPASLAALEWVTIRQFNGGRWMLALAGTPGWCREYAQGICVAVALGLASIDDAWLLRTCLWLASLRGSLDDSLLLEDGALWLVRRHAHEISSVELEASLGQQLAVAGWLATHGSPARDTVVTNKMGNWA